MGGERAGKGLRRCGIRFEGRNCVSWEASSSVRCPRKRFCFTSLYYTRFLLARIAPPRWCAFMVATRIHLMMYQHFHGTVPWSQKPKWIKSDDGFMIPTPILPYPTLFSSIDGIFGHGGLSEPPLDSYMSAELLLNPGKTR